VTEEKTCKNQENKTERSDSQGCGSEECTNNTNQSCSNTKEQVTEEAKKAEDLSKEELLDLLKRTQANFENFKKQNQEHVNEVVRFANKKLLSELIPTLDSFDMALRGSEKSQGEVKIFLDGMKMVLDSFVLVLENNGVNKINQINTFDPKIHEAIEKVESEEDEGKILEVIQSGYTINDKVIRAARVKISSKRLE
tara:strand:+ start:397 stop:984 length:588 start_codon:yes stop_codon:yes gene_type:complete